MQQVARRTKAERRAERARQRAEATRRAEARRRLQIVAAAIVLVTAVALGAALVGRGGSPTGGGEAAASVTAPSDPSEVSVSSGARSQPLAAGDAVPSFTAPAIGGGTFDLSRYEGSPMVLSVWAPWCPHCQVELPVLASSLRAVPGVQLVSVVTSIGDNPGPAPDQYLRENNLSFPTAIDDTKGSIATALGIRGFPTIYFVDSSGKVTQMLEGEVDAATIQQAARALA
jgi:peroxiredoxin